jgi:hypothetical protein
MLEEYRRVTPVDGQTGRYERLPSTRNLMSDWANPFKPGGRY